MTGVLTLFGETDLQSALHNSFRQNELYFVRFSLYSIEIAEPAPPLPKKSSS